eukprot:TRINITY_DN26119_c1_g4_i2.p1 TRINITY_DN26119_c1_g4~~TRINITY_DN26119_c1_g4_i2.p1  ORF type:complete len:575 (-),score=139.07 TRINITY_DN26119_c1_g4_i2:594-2318(-)
MGGSGGEERDSACASGRTGEAGLTVTWRGQQQPVALASTADEAERLVEALLARRPMAFGFDTEWSSQREVAVLQLAGADMCLVLLLPEVELKQCPLLLGLLADSELVKAGVGVAQDAVLLQKSCGEGAAVAGCCDLFMLAAREEVVSAARPCSLAHLCKVLFDEELPKDDAIRRSNWGQRPLSEEHLRYAARDALAGRDCAEALAQRCCGPPAEQEELALQFARWCGDLLDRKAAPKRAGGGGGGAGATSPKPSSCSENGGGKACHAYSCVKKFGTRRIIDSEGRTMLHMRDRTVDGLIRRNLATKLEEEDGEEVIRLHFSPIDRYDYAGLDAAERNACVGCGSSGVARYYVVPRVFFVHLSQDCKSYNCHDIVMLCPSCRAIAEAPQLERIKTLLGEHGGACAGSGVANETTLDPILLAGKKAAKALSRPPCGGRKGQLPEHKQQEFRAAVAAALNVEEAELTRENIERAVRLGEGPTPAERVCAVSMRDASSLRAFLKDWRSLFVTALKPRFLSEGWAVDTGLEGRFVPSVAHTVEWPGDWRCASCGVHCFGRSSKCRKCGAPPPEEILAQA